MKPKTNVVWATANETEFNRARRCLERHEIETFPPAFFGINQINSEITTISFTRDERMRIAWNKAEACAEALSQNKSLRGERFLALAASSEFEVSALNGDLSRKLKQGMDDEQVIASTLELMKDFEQRRRLAFFSASLCIIGVNTNGTVSDPIMVEGILEGRIHSEPGVARIEGNPFASIFYVVQYGKLLAYLRPQDELCHQGRAIEAAVPVIKKLAATYSPSYIFD